MKGASTIVKYMRRRCKSFSHYKTSAIGTCAVFDSNPSHACGSSKAVRDLVEELLGRGVLALSQPPMRFMVLYNKRQMEKRAAMIYKSMKASK